MKIKSLLLGSAAALVAVSGAQAADAIIVEPEPMEYVKVCDMYGAGYFYIPGTETCLKIRGDVRVQYLVDTYHDEDYNTNSNHDVTVRARLGFTAKNETEYGTLGSDILVTWTASDSSEGHDDFSVNDGQPQGGGLSIATINLAGFRTGYDNDNGGAWNRYTSYGLYNNWSGGYYNFNSAIFFEYGGSAGGVNYVVGIQDSPESGSSGQPDIYAAMNTSFSGLTLGAIAMYDSNGGDGDYNSVTNQYDENGDGAFAYRVSAIYDMSSFISRGSLRAWWESDNGDTDYVKGHKWGVTMTAGVTSNIDVYAGYSAYDAASDRSVSATAFAAGLDSDDYDGAYWNVGMAWTPVSGLKISAEWGKNITEGETFANFTENSKDTFVMRILRSF